MELVSNTAASLIADLCGDNTRLPIYWTSMYSPCTGIFLPMFIEGGLNKSISFGEIKSSANSAWWNFYYMNQSLKTDSPQTKAQLREEFDNLQHQFFSTAYDLAEDNYNLIRKNRYEVAEKRLTEYMDHNFVRAINIAKSYIKTSKFSQNALNSKLSLG